MRLQFYVADRDVYWSTFIDFAFLSETGVFCEYDETTMIRHPFINNHVYNELWVDGAA